MPSFAQTEPAKAFPPTLLALHTWKLTWNGEFNGTRLGETKWNRHADHQHRDGYWLKEDTYLNGKGKLILRTNKEWDRFTCGAIDTKGKYEHAFGCHVVRIKMPKLLGHWPAFWLQTTSMTKVGDEGRDGTEIDIVGIPWRDGRTEEKIGAHVVGIGVSGLRPFQFLRGPF